MKDLRCLPTIKSSTSSFWGTVIDFEECVIQGYDAVELCWYGDEYSEQKLMTCISVCMDGIAILSSFLIR